MAGVVPHAGYGYSGPVAAHFFRQLARAPAPATVLVLGVDHHGASGMPTVTDQDWKTPLGEVSTDLALLRKLCDGPVDLDPLAQRQEHSIEVEVPFLQTVYEGEPFRFVGLQVPFTDFSLLENLGRHVRRCVLGRDVLLLASTDFSHYLPRKLAREKDDRALEPLLALKAKALYDRVVREDISMCGIAPTVTLLAALEGSSVVSELLARGDSADAEPMDQVVGYASISIRAKGSVPSP